VRGKAGGDRAYFPIAFDSQNVVNGLPALGIGGERRKELCAVERSTEANAEPRKARPLAPITVKTAMFLPFGG